MNIAFVSNVVYPFVTGGAQKRIHELGRRLADRNHEITIYGRHYWDGPRTVAHEGMRLRAVAPAAELYADERRSITEAIDYSARLLPHLRRRVDEHDLVVVSVFPYFPVVAAEVATLATDTPIVTTWHEVWGDYWDDYLGALAPFGKAVERLAAWTPQHPVAVSGVTADRLAEIGPAREGIDVLPNGIDVDQVRDAPKPPDGGYDVLFAGRLIEDKRVDVLLDAFDRIADRHDATLGVIGEGPESDRLRRHARGLEHADRVEMLGFLEEYEDVLGYMRAADVFASPSTREGFGITYVEAMAAGCVVIGAEHPGSAAAEVIDDGGYTASPTVDAVADALDRALADRTLLRDPTDVAARYDWDNVARRAEDVYRAAVTG